MGNISETIRWKIPKSVLADSGPYTIQIYQSQSGEDGAYAVIDTISSGPGNSVRTYTDVNGDPSYFYYVVYTDQNGVVGDRVLAMFVPTVREQRISEQIYGHMPEIIRARLDEDFNDIRKTMYNALATINAYTPATDYAFSNMPPRFETAIVVFTMTLLFMEKHLQVSIRDYSYGGTGITLAVDRNSKFTATISELSKQLNELLAFVKMGDWADPIGIGTEAIGTPQGRIFSFLFGTGSY
jgi:hypothetical protein